MKQGKTIEKPKKKEVKELAFNRDEFNRDEARAEIIKKAEKEERENERDDSE